MGEVINLRRARKEKARQEKAKEATASRTAHGQTKAVKKLFGATDEKAKRDLDAHKRDKD
jgi:hypothetical protein